MNKKELEKKRTELVKKYADAVDIEWEFVANTDGKFIDFLINEIDFLQMIRKNQGLMINKQRKQIEKLDKELQPTRDFQTLLKSVKKDVNKLEKDIRKKWDL
jgi:hypothetical protein